MKTLLALAEGAITVGLLTCVWAIAAIPFFMVIRFGLRTMRAHDRTSLVWIFALSLAAASLLTPRPTPIITILVPLGWDFVTGFTSYPPFEPFYRQLHIATAILFGITWIVAFAHIWRLLRPREDA